MEETQTPPPVTPTPVTPTPVSHEKNTLMAILAYIGPLIIISYVTAKDDSFVKYHIKQGLLLIIGSVAIWLISSLFWHFWMLINLVNAAIFILAILGIINAANGEEKELPLIGHLSRNFKF